MHLANGRHRERLCPYSLQCCKADCLFAFLSRCLGVCVLLPVHTWMLSPSCIWFLSHLLRVTYNWVVSLLLSYPLYVCLHVIDLLQIYLLFCLSNCLSEYLYYLYSLFVCLIDWLLIILFGWLSFWVSVCLSIGVTFMLCVCITIAARLFALSSTHTATGSLNRPSSCIRNMRSPPLTYSITKYRRSWNSFDYLNNQTP